MGGARVVPELDSVLADPQIDAIAIATPASTHHEIAMAALEAGKHVLVEKPHADTQQRGEEMVGRASERGLVLMADHTSCYTPAVMKMLGHRAWWPSRRSLSSISACSTSAAAAWRRRSRRVTWLS